MLHMRVLPVASQVASLFPVPDPASLPPTSSVAVSSPALLTLTTLSTRTPAVQTTAEGVESLDGLLSEVDYGNRETEALLESGNSKDTAPSHHETPLQATVSQGLSQLGIPGGSATCMQGSFFLHPELGSAEEYINGTNIIPTPEELTGISSNADDSFLKDTNYVEDVAIPFLPSGYVIITRDTPEFTLFYANKPKLEHAFLKAARLHGARLVCSEILSGSFSALLPTISDERWTLYQRAHSYFKLEQLYIPLSSSNVHDCLNDIMRHAKTIQQDNTRRAHKQPREDQSNHLSNALQQASLTTARVSLRGDSYQNDYLGSVERDPTTGRSELRLVFNQLAVDKYKQVQEKAKVRTANARNQSESRQ
ncbi:hypothetical protein GUITHDRAFT_135319 [Guillardia theta CCMP2712]|uniref:Uncharacterized protein n=2 Tax=Guillardia theta TaxID=55529 RepID=L1JPK8_GUITC|nr:hypothetical protein GUITHDRAFT_135319 [Guillardia theta CCMP2712]EKX50130.1 hypothetical protein GUITHDRAFT_135319 [Guillardia theta CCMP2712]|eukprot:XP_005837110.1 hypothetical protein GUITHDRAFT_135319 [Guillardia theta CCMP2712]